jgi:hypothetical protein
VKCKDRIKKLTVPVSVRQIWLRWMYPRRRWRCLRTQIRFHWIILRRFCRDARPKAAFQQGRERPDDSGEAVRIAGRSATGNDRKIYFTIVTFHPGAIRSWLFEVIFNLIPFLKEVTSCTSRNTQNLVALTSISNFLMSNSIWISS